MQHPIKLWINGIEHDLRGVTTIRDVLDAMQLPGEFFAVALNNQFVPRSRYSQTRVQASDRLEIVQPMQGG